MPAGALHPGNEGWPTGSRYGDEFHEFDNSLGALGVCSTCFSYHSSARVAARRVESRTHTPGAVVSGG